MPIATALGPRGIAWLIVALAASACAPSADRASTAPASVTPAAPNAPQPGESLAPSLASAAPAPSVAPSPIVVPDGALYVCVTDDGGAMRQAVMELEPKIGALCSRHPEMGPCRYERDLCRRGGGRVFAAQGVEITMQTEAEYDKKVLRVRLQAN